LSVAIKKGERIGIIGKTGSGKSTIIDIIMGLLEPTEGEILIDGKAVNSTMQLSWRKNVSHVPQHIFLTDSSVAENIAFGINKNEINLERVKLSAYNSQINKFIEKYPSGYDTFAGERGIRLSGGQRQRIGIARALYKQTCVLVLDEATSALDDLTEKAVMESINNLGREMTIIIIAHRTTTLQGCDRIIELSGGKIIREGTYKEIIGDGLDWFVSNHSNSESKTN
jgi:ATP-binding cassette subfamily B protein